MGLGFDEVKVVAEEKLGKGLEDVAKLGCVIDDGGCVELPKLGNGLEPVGCGWLWPTPGKGFVLGDGCGAPNALDAGKGLVPIGTAVA